MNKIKIYVLALWTKVYNFIYSDYKYLYFQHIFYIYLICMSFLYIQIGTFSRVCKSFSRQATTAALYLVYLVEFFKNFNS